MTIVIMVTIGDDNFDYNNYGNNGITINDKDIKKMIMDGFFKVNAMFRRKD